MCVINLKSFLDGRSYPEAGELFYSEILKYISDTDRIVVNMSDVDLLPSMFLNVSIGKLIDTYGKQRVKETISFTMITKSQASRLKDYFERY